MFWILKYLVIVDLQHDNVRTLLSGTKNPACDRLFVSSYVVNMLLKSTLVHFTKLKLLQMFFITKFCYKLLLPWINCFTILIPVCQSCCHSIYQVTNYISNVGKIRKVILSNYDLFFLSSHVMFINKYKWNWFSWLSTLYYIYDTIYPFVYKKCINWLV